jgi:cytochrome c biogenesis protein CcmG/thiol:disulfide interchange protein DsbE
MTPEPNRRSSLVFWLVIAAGMAVVALGVVFAGRFGSDPTLSPSPLIGAQVPDVTIPYLEFDGTVDLRDLEGDIVVVNFWASWCLSCRAEHEALLAAAADYADFDVTFVGVLYQDTVANGLDFLSEMGRGDPYVYVEDADSRVALEFGVLGLPETFFIDRSGIIVGKVSGPVSRSLLDATLQALVLGQSIDDQVTTGEVENRD